MYNPRRTRTLYREIPVKRYQVIAMTALIVIAYYALTAHFIPNLGM